MLGVQNAVHHWITHVQIRRGHIDLRPQRARSVGKLAFAHALEQIEILLDRAVPKWAVTARLSERAASLSNLLCAEIIDVSLACLDQLYRPFIKLIEVVGCVVHPIFPIESQPAYIANDRIDILLLFFL